MNIVSRFLGGAASDAAANRRGMRGRMWVLLLLLLLEGLFCLLVGIVHDSMAATVSVVWGSKQQRWHTNSQLVQLDPFDTTNQQGA